MKQKLAIILALIIGISILDGCIPSKPVREERTLSADRLIKNLEANRRKIKTFRATGVISIESKSLNAKSNFEVLLQKPDSIKVSFYGPFGVDLAHALITQRHFQFYDVINNRMYEGVNKSGIIKQILKVDLSFDELIDALAGSVNLTDKLRTEPDKFENTQSDYNLTYDDSTDGKQSIYKIRIDDLGITDYQMKKLGGPVLLEGRYSEFKTFDEVPVPYRISLLETANSQKLNIEYRNIEVNKNIGSLQLTVPEDVNIIQW